MSAELRLKKLRGSGGYVMAKVSDEEQMKGNLGGPDLFLAPIGRLDEERISKYFCNTCEREFDDPPKIEYENLNEEVAENLMLVEKGQYLCSSCNSSIAEYREFRKSDEAAEIGNAKPMESVQSQTVSDPAETYTQQEVQDTQQAPEATQVESQSHSSQESISSIEGLSVYDENAKKIGNAKQVGIDSNQTMVLVITQNDGSEISMSWTKVKKVGEVILTGTPDASPPETSQPGKCSSCGYANKEGSKFCEQCGNKL